MVHTRLSEYLHNDPVDKSIKIEKIKRNIYIHATNQLLRFGCSNQKCDWSGEFSHLFRENCENGVVELTYKCPKCSEKRLYIYKKSMFKTSFVEDFMDKLAQLKR